MIFIGLSWFLRAIKQMRLAVTPENWLSKSDNWINLGKAPFLVFENREMAASFVKSDKTRML
ncbi:hypothetical protein IX84_31190 [Phaeodactylibacter xiamenensis]|uniref:Uncharacterized protein n=1 Tax=Phaeodactylibacter xiamenensis TaxID=1524460 RepID=A0A098RYG7_9BACT|nr:hypothetical protein IX84_31190 [Phaeodactylibacter xiamenensis]